jgi:hypothetical protein
MPEAPSNELMSWHAFDATCVFRADGGSLTFVPGDFAVSVSVVGVLLGAARRISRGLPLTGSEGDADGVELALRVSDAAGVVWETRRSVSCGQFLDLFRVCELREPSPRQLLVEDLLGIQGRSPIPVLDVQSRPLVFQNKGMVRVNLWKVPDRSGDKLALHVPEGFARSIDGTLPFWGVTNWAPTLVLFPSVLGGWRMSGAYGDPCVFRDVGQRGRPQASVRFEADRSRT